MRQKCRGCNLSVDCVWQENRGGTKAAVSKLRISALDRLHVKVGSCTRPGPQLIRLGSDVAERFSLGVILGRTELSPNSSFPRNFMIWPIANCRSVRVGLASKERRIHSGCEYHAPVLT